jgi:hypothetical protein
MALAFREVTSRSPDDTERGLLLKLLEKNRARYNGDTNSANDLVRIGNAPLAKELDVVELAAWTEVCRAMFNLNETITRE